MISARAARFVASAHKWLGLIVAAQLLVWTATGLFFAAFHISDVRGEKLVKTPEAAIVDLSRVNLTMAEALNAVVEDRPSQVTLRSIAGQPVYEVRAQIGVFLVSAETGAVLSPIPEDLARRIALDAWLGQGALKSMELLEEAPRESGLNGEVWAARFEGRGSPVLYIAASTGQLGPPRTDLWRTYDFLWGLHIMDYGERENFNTPWMTALAFLALSTTLFGVVLLAHRLMRGKIRGKEAP